jgi:polyhydroxyalkanoate synthesis regulator phasin
MGKDGRLNPEQAKAFVDDMVQQLKSEQGNLDLQLQRQLRNMMQELGFPASQKWTNFEVGLTVWSVRFVT